MSGGVCSLVAMGGSWGGIAALRTILSSLPRLEEAAVAVVLHRQRVRSELAHVLGRGAAMPVVEPEDKTPLTPGVVYVAPPDYHLLVERGWLALSTDEPVKFSRPSIDVLLESAASAYRRRAVAVVLTGASDDGADGARAVHRQGGTVLVQDPATAEQAVMPRAVVAAGVADIVAPLEDLAQAIVTAVRQGENPGRYA